LPKSDTAHNSDACLLLTQTILSIPKGQLRQTTTNPFQSSLCFKKHTAVLSYALIKIAQYTTILFNTFILITSPKFQTKWVSRLLQHPAFKLQETQTAHLLFSIS